MKIWNKLEISIHFPCTYPYIWNMLKKYACLKTSPICELSSTKFPNLLFLVVFEFSLVFFLVMANIPHSHHIRQFLGTLTPLLGENFVYNFWAVIIILALICACIFCGLLSSQKVLGARKDGAPLPLVNKTMMYLPKQHSGGSSSTGLIQTQIIAYVTSIAVAFFLSCPFNTVYGSFCIDTSGRK